MKYFNNKSYFIFAVTILFIWGCGGQDQAVLHNKSNPHYRLPADADTLCTITNDNFKNWFVKKEIILNGKIAPANSVEFPDNVNCDFYMWSEQMFLWLISPAREDKYLPGNLVIEDTIFYDVSEKIDNKRTLTQHKPGLLINVSSALTETGPDELPVVIDDKGNLLEVEEHNAKNKGHVKTLSDKGTLKDEEVVGISDGPDPSHHKIIGKQNKIIDHPKAVLSRKDYIGNVVEAIENNGKKIYIDTAGNEHTISIGQATDGDVLMSAQNHSLVYYVIVVNDIFAFNLMAIKNNWPGINKDEFPTKPKDRDAICAYARSKNVTLRDSNALALELKLSLVDTAGLKDLDSYITIDANVPLYDTSNRYKWIPKGTRQTRLALIGMHVVGSAKGNPEMIWATFEHKKNAPNGSYDYINLKKETVHVPPDTGTGWLLCSNSLDTPYNIPHMKVKDGGIIDTLSGNDISPSSTKLLYPFGTDLKTIPNPDDSNSAISNTKIISINNSVHNKLKDNDLRNNYIFIGATWTQGGAPPKGIPYLPPKDISPGVSVGTNLLVNSTMETYDQFGGHNCLSCHYGRLKPAGNNLSHISGSILQGLPTVPPAIRK